MDYLFGAVHAGERKVEGCVAGAVLPFRRPTPTQAGESMSPAPTRNFVLLGRWLVVAGLIGTGVQQLIIQNFVRLVPKLPAWVPAPAIWVNATGLALIAIGVAIATGKLARAAALSLAAMLAVMLVALYLPGVLGNPGAGFMWTNPCKTLALIGGALMLASLAPGSQQLGLEHPRSGDATEASRPHGLEPVSLAPVFLGIFLLVCGVQHFVYAGFVDTLVPAWIPPGQRFWTIFSALALIAGGAGILVPRTARLAGAMSGLMIFLWVLLLHIPRALATPREAGETSAIFEALALSGVAFLVAGTRRAAAR
jgi:uncharacterized membrane protein